MTRTATHFSGDVGLLHGLEAMAAFLGITHRQAKHWAVTQGMPTFKMGRSVCATKGALTTWMAEMQAAGREAGKSPARP